MGHSRPCNVAHFSKLKILASKPFDLPTNVANSCALDQNRLRPKTVSVAKLYQYVGPAEIREAVRDQPAGALIQQAHDVSEWLRTQGVTQASREATAVTYTIGEDMRLHIADRHSEHVACAAGGPVTAAGEMTFEYQDGEIVVTEVSNQSTGFCPEPLCWEVVALVLDQIPIARPETMTANFLFRLCPSCNERNLVKDDWFVCALCEADLPREWNFS